MVCPGYTSWRWYQRPSATYSTTVRLNLKSKQWLVLEVMLLSIIRAFFRIDLIDVSMKIVKLMSSSNAYLVGEEKSIYLDRFIDMLSSNPIKSTETLTVGLHRRPSRHAFTLKLRLRARLTVSTQQRLILKFQTMLAASNQDTEDEKNFSAFRKWQYFEK